MKSKHTIRLRDELKINESIVLEVQQKNNLISDQNKTIQKLNHQIIDIEKDKSKMKSDFK